MNINEPTASGSITQPVTGAQEGAITAASSAWACVKLSVAMRDGLFDYWQELKPREWRLAHLLIRCSYDVGQLAGRCAFERWAARILPVEAEKGARADKCRALMEELVKRGLVDWNQGQDTFELRPWPGDWLRTFEARGLELAAGDDNGQVNLPLRAERLLSEAGSELSREKVLATVDGQVSRGPDPVDRSMHGPNQDWPAMWSLAKGALDDPAVEAQLKERLAAMPGPYSGAGGPESGGEIRHQGAERGGGEIRHGATVANLATEKVAESAGDLAVAKSATGPPIAKLSSVLKAKAKLSYRVVAKSATEAGEAGAEAEATPERALRWLESVDRKGTLRVDRFRPDYVELCAQHPGYVLTTLKWALEEHEAHYRRTRDREYQLGDPVGWMGKRAASAGKMKWRGRK